MEAEKQKSSALQIMRGLAIILVLVRHAIAQVNADTVLNAVEQIIICFHMPAFFVISGYLFQKNYNKYVLQGKIKFIINKAKHLLLPYAFWTIFLWMVIQVACCLGNSIKNMMIGIGFGPMSVKELLFGLLTYETYYSEHLWFLYVLFVFFVINIVLGEYGKKVWILPVAFLLGLLTSFVVWPHIVERCMTWSIFFFFGRYIAENERIKDRIQFVKNRKQFVCIIAAFAALCVVRLMLMHFKCNFFAQFFVKYAIGFIGVWLLYGISFHITRLKTAFCVIGDYSYDIYLMHNPYCVALSAIVLNKMLGITPYIAVIAATALGVLIPMLASKLIIRKIKPLSILMIGK